jgi:hypothetical protein
MDLLLENGLQFTSRSNASEPTAVPAKSGGLNRSVLHLAQATI